MKKYIALALGAVLVLGLLTGCAKAPALRVAMSPDFAPMEFVDASKTGQDQFVGFDVSLASYLAKEMGMELEIVPMSFDACQSAVEEGKVDMAISGFSWMPDRAERFGLSDTYHAGDNESRQVLLTTAENKDLCSDAASLAGSRIGAQSASLQECLVREQLPEARVVPFDSITDGVDRLRKGDILAMAVAEGNADAIIISNPDLCKSGFCFELTEDLLDNLILMPKGSDELTAAVNKLLAKAREAGYYERWYADALELVGVGIEVSYNADGYIATEGT